MKSGHPSWADLDKTLSILSKVSSEEWTWIRNSRCKYISLSVDMRSGECLIKDRDGNVITLDQLGYQYEVKS